MPNGMTYKYKKEYENAMAELQAKEEEQHRKDTLFLSTIENSISKEVFQKLNAEIQESESYSNLRIIDKPIGEPQDKGVWVNQFVGCSGDDYHGTVCFELPDKTFLAWDYSM